jgi:hypothetical protein
MITKTFEENLCKLLGHDLRVEYINDDAGAVVDLKQICDRCGRAAQTRIPYIELQNRRFNLFERAKDRLNREFNE